MAKGYTDIDDTNLDYELFRKEYASLRTNAAILSKYLKKKENPSYLSQITKDRLNLTKYQKFPTRWINPNTLNERLLLKFDTGTGKTVTVISTALNFVKQYMDAYRTWETDTSPSIFIIGFARNIFIKELMRRPEFGFISRDEIAHEAKLRTAAAHGSQIERDELTRFHTEIKKRFTKKSMGGFFRFYGYKELFNRLFIFTEDGMRKMSASVGEQLESRQLTEDQILNGLKDGFIRINWDLVDQIKNGFIACDEFHNAYNALSINNYGIALRIILMIHDRPDIMQKWIPFGSSTEERKRRYEFLKSSSVRAIFMTATPINNSPTEIIDLLNVLVKLGRIQEFYKLLGDKSPSDRLRLDKNDFFDGRVLRADALDNIADLIRGSVSYLSDTTPAYFPTYEFAGSEIRIPPSLASGKRRSIPYLKFIRCPMSPLHYKTYKAVFQGTLPPDGQNLIDMVLPNPASEEIGLFKTRDIKQILKSAPIIWKRKKEIDVVAMNIGGNTQTDVIVGNFLKLPHLQQYSTKYAHMMEDVIHNLKNDGGKMVINHQAVRGSGVLFIDEVLRANGIIDENSEPLPNTLCSKCGFHMFSHKTKHKTHDFVPARFIMLHSDIDAGTREHSVEKYKHINNLMGYLYRIALGSQIINESIDLSEVREIKIMTVPDDISTLIQIIGRAIRKGSHLRLPPHLRHVLLQIYTTSLPDETNDLSYEERRYLEKSMDYLVIQEIDRVLNVSSVDLPLNFELVKNSTGLIHLPFEMPDGPWKPYVVKNKAVPLSAITMSTWNIFYQSEEVSTIEYIIKRLFIENSRCWKYTDLFEAVKNPPFEVFVDSTLFSETSFALALDRMVEDEYMTPETLVRKNSEIDALYDPMDRTIFIDGKGMRIVAIGEYYMLMPLIYESGSTGSDSVGRNVQDLLGAPNIDFDNWHRGYVSPGAVSFNITNQLQTSSASYESLKQRFYKSYKNAPISDFPLSLEIYGMDFHIRLVQDAIRYAFNILTNPDMRFSELHTFYFKVLYFYDKFDLIVYCSDVVDTSLAKTYDAYILSSKARATQKKIDLTAYNAFLMSSINKSAGLSKAFNMNRLDDYLGRVKTPESLSTRPYVMKNIVDDTSWIPKPKKISKVPHHMLPIGHLISFVGDAVSPVLYNPNWRESKEARQEWQHVPQFSAVLNDIGQEKENDLMVGYYDQNPNSIELRFKLRAPIHKMVKHIDTRMQERGSVCNTRKKDDLLRIATSLNLDLKDDPPIASLCNTIKLELMRREIAERRIAHKKSNYTRLRWFYFHFERQPSFL